MSGRCTHCDVIFAKGQLLIDREHFASKEVKAKIKQVQANWIRVKELVQNREERLKDAAQSLQVRLFYYLFVLHLPSDCSVNFIDNVLLSIATYYK